MSHPNGNANTSSPEEMAPQAQPPVSKNIKLGFNNRIGDKGEFITAFFAGLLGAALIIISSFIRWVVTIDSGFYKHEELSSPPAFSAFLLLLGLALLIGVLIAYIWQDRLAGSIFCIIISGGFCITGFVFTAIHISTTPVTDAIGKGAYLGLAGGLCGLLAGLLFLSSRKRINHS